ncbi:MAG: MFS transporter [Acidobacteriota bacterium]
MPENRRGTGMRWMVCGLLLLITIVNYLDRSTLGLVEPLLRHVLGADQNVVLYNEHYGDIVTCFVLAYGIGYLFAGRVIDWMGAKWGLAVAIAVWACASIGHTFARTVVGFGLARFVLGLGESGSFPAALKATADWFPPEERALATGIFNSGTSAASLLAPLLIPWVALGFGWRGAFYTTGGLSLFWLVCWLLFPYDRLRRKNSAAGGGDAGNGRPRLSYFALLGKRGTWNFALSKALTDPVWWFYLFWLPKFFHEQYGVEMAMLGLPLVIVYLGGTVGSIAGGWLAGFAMRRGQPLRQARRFAMLVCALCTTAVILVPFVHRIWEAIGLLCVATAAHQGWSANLLTTPSDMFDSSSVATVVGIGGAVGSLGSSIFTTLAGVLWTRHSLPIFFVAGFAYLISMAAFQWKPPEPAHAALEAEAR